MSVTCRRPTDDTDGGIACSPSGTTGGGGGREAIVLGDPASTGYDVVLPPAATDTAVAISALTLRTPFVAYRRSADERTTYDSVEAFLREHPDGDAVRDVLEEHFDYSR